MNIGSIRIPWPIVVISLLVLTLLTRCEYTNHQEREAHRVWMHPASPSLPLRSTLDTQFTESVSFSPDGHLLASGGTSVQLWTPADGHATLTLEGSRGGASVAFSPNGQFLAASVDNAVGLWSVHDGSQIRIFRDTGFRAGVSLEVPNIAFSMDGRILAGAAEDHGIRLWEVKSGGLLHTLKVSAPPPPLPGPGECVAKPCDLKADERGIRSITFSPVDHTLAVCLWNGTVQLWDAGSATLKHSIDANATSNAAFSPDGTLLVLGHGNDLHIRSVHDGTLVKTIAVHRGESWRTNLTVWQVALSGDGRAIAVGSYYFYTHPTFWDQVRDVGPPPLSSRESTIHVYRVADGRVLGMIPRYQAPIRSIAFSPDNLRVAATNGDEVHIWEIHR